MTIIRQLGEHDISTVLDTLEAQANKAWTGDLAVLAGLAQRAATGDGVGVLALGENGELLGVTLVLMPTGAPAELAALWVAASSRRRGLARAMLASLAEVWKNQPILVTAPPDAQLRALSGLLPQFAFSQLAPGRSHVTGAVWKTRRVKRSTGRASLASL